MPARSLHSLGVCRIITSSASKKQIGIGVPNFVACSRRKNVICGFLLSARVGSGLARAKVSYERGLRGIERCAVSTRRYANLQDLAHPVGVGSEVFKSFSWRSL